MEKSRDKKKIFKFNPLSIASKIFPFVSLLQQTNFKRKECEERNWTTLLALFVRATFLQRRGSRFDSSPRSGEFFLFPLKRNQTSSKVDILDFQKIIIKKCNVNDSSQTDSFKVLQNSKYWKVLISVLKHTSQSRNLAYLRFIRKVTKNVMSMIPLKSIASKFYRMASTEKYWFWYPNTHHKHEIWRTCVS